MEVVVKFSDTKLTDHTLKLVVTQSVVMVWLLPSIRDGPKC